MICKVLIICDIAIVIYYNQRLKLRTKFFKDCCKDKQPKFQLKNSAIYSLKSSNKLVFAYIIKT